jgi:hypothetical protein
MPLQSLYASTYATAKWSCSFEVYQHTKAWYASAVHAPVTVVNYKSIIILDSDSASNSGSSHASQRYAHSHHFVMNDILSANLHAQGPRGKSTCRLPDNHLLISYVDRPEEFST